MKKTIIVYCLLIINYLAVGQVGNNYEFGPLRVHDTIKTQKAFNSIKGIDKVNGNFFFATEYSKENRGLFLIEKKEKYWIVYDYNEFVSNYVVKKHRNLNSNYVSISVGAQRSGYGINIYSWYLIFDLKNKSYLTLSQYAYNADEKDVVIRKCESDIQFKNSSFIIKRSCFPKEECGSCIESGVYKIKNGKLAEINSSH